MEHKTHGILHAYGINYESVNDSSIAAMGGYQTVIEIIYFVFGTDAVNFFIKKRFNFYLQFMNFFQQTVEIERCDAEIP